MNLKKITIVGGCGHIGLPLGLVMAKNSYDVTLFDINQKSVDSINGGIIPFLEEGAEELLGAFLGKNLRATNDKKYLNDSDIIIFALGTPVDEHLHPKIPEFLSAVLSYKDYMNSSQLIILRSTLFPGTAELLGSCLARELGNVKLAFCPERIVQGKGIVEIEQLPQIISGNCSEALSEAEELFGNITAKSVRLEMKEAELAKLYTNSWRYIEFAIANQFYMLANDNGIDFYRVLEALKKDYPRAKHFPAAGLTAGPCLFKDTMQLSAFSDNNFFLGLAAMQINEGLPNHLVKELKEKFSGSLKEVKVAVLGMTFKPDNDDTRESLSFKIKKLLEFEQAEVILSDPYLENTCALDEALQRADAFILGVPHREYRELKLQKPFVDCWGVW